MDEYILFIYLTIASTTIPLIGVIIKFTSRPPYLRWLGLLLTLSLISDVSSSVFPELRSFSGNIYPMIELIIISIIYTIIFNSKKYTTAIVVIIGLFLLYKIFQIGYYEDINAQSFRFRVLTSFWFLLLSVSFFIALQKRPPMESILHYPLIWFNTAILTYFAGNIFLFTAYMTFIDIPNLHKLYVPIHGFFNIIQNCIFALALYFNYKEIVSE